MPVWVDFLCLLCVWASVFNECTLGVEGGLIGDCRLDVGRSCPIVLQAGISSLHCNWQNGNCRSPLVPALSVAGLLKVCCINTLQLWRPNSFLCVLATFWSVVSSYYITVLFWLSDIKPFIHFSVSQQLMCSAVGFHFCNLATFLSL